ncbi:hypothetical protein ACTA71_000407 [Dictyostelium dimigraforme]
MKKLFIQYENDIICDQSDSFSLLNNNKKLIKNESNRKTMTWISNFSNIKLGILIYFLYLSSFIFGIVGIINITDNSENNEQWPFVMAITGFLVFGFSFIISLIRIITSDITKSLKNLRRNENQIIQDYINGIEDCTVELYCKCECYHIDSSFSNSLPNSSSVSLDTTSTITTTRKVITYREEIKIPISETIDLTNPLIMDEINLHYGDFKYLKVSFFRDWMPDDEMSQIIIKSVVDHLTLKNEKRDNNFKIYLDLQYVDKKFKEHILFPLPSSFSPPFLFRYGFYYLSLFIFMYLPFEFYFFSKVYKSEFSFVKLIKTSEHFIEFVKPPVISIQTSQYQPLEKQYSLDELQFNNKILQKQFSTINLSKENRILQKQLSNLSMDINF